MYLTLNFLPDPFLAREAPLAGDDAAEVGEGLRGQDESLGQEALPDRRGVVRGQGGWNQS